MREEVTVDAFSTNSPHVASIYSDVPHTTHTYNPGPWLLGGARLTLNLTLPHGLEALLPLRPPVVHRPVFTTFGGRYYPHLSSEDHLQRTIESPYSS